MPIIQALDRALNILELFDEQATELKITEISARMDLHKSTVHSLLRTLQLHGYIDQNPESGKYRLGLKLIEKGQLVLQGMDVRTVARRQLETLSDQTGQTTNLVILDGKEGVYIDKVEGAKAAIRYSRIGRRVPLHSSAAGKILLAHMRQDRLEELLRQYHFHIQTPQTIQDQDTLLRELEQVRMQGYAIDNQENEAGVRCGAVPIRDHSNQVIAAMSLSTMTSAIGDEQFLAYISLLQKEGESVSQHLGYRR